MSKAPYFFVYFTTKERMEMSHGKQECKEARTDRSC